ncbi:MAG: hypothetical protein ASARMPREDX12_001820 [Alectoria sarmentosa]|nr:MAG: hypothetical protein ASARMPREDX12_001820 [Alectoria sarmentosa]CAD6578382.1 MAG: hypothetical protein ASARMPRED_008703 [Alectoria sarmentosa]
MPVQQPLQRDSSNLSQDQTNALQTQNQAREAANGISGAVSRPDLVWDPNLANDAQKWANGLAAANNGLNHSTGDQRPNEGENLYWVSAGGQLADAAQAWVNEQSNYSGEKIGDGNFEGYGHYTQCIWPTTTAVGMASAVSSSGANFIVGRYSPPGNYTGTSAYTGQ